MVRAVLRWLAYAPLDVGMSLLAVILSPVLALLSMVTGPILPGWLALFHTHTVDLDGGQKELGWPKASGVRLWWQRTCWIARNPGYGFSDLLGIHPFVHPSMWRTVYRNSIPKFPRFFAVMVVTHPESGKKYFSVRSNWFWIGWNPYGPGFPPTSNILKASLRRP